ncbi:MAG: class I SAM-dependent methyltransferase [Halobacteriaceae archaeon]
MGDDIRGRITDQFSDRGERADIWHVLESFLDTESYLNLGYSPWYLPHVIGSSQRRLATKIGETIAEELDATSGRPLLDVGCGRGGPAHHLASRFGFAVTGVDLVPHNLALARRSGTDPAFVLGDATRLPFEPDAFTACTAIDAIVYLPDRSTVFEAVFDVLEPGGVFVFSDLLLSDDAETTYRPHVDAFADAWDMPPLATPTRYTDALEAAGFTDVATTDLTESSVGRFRKWTTLYRLLHASPLGPILDWWLNEHGLDAASIHDQLRRAHEALPALEHRLFIAHTPHE